MAPESNAVDVLIIGGGPAGQTAAVSVARNVHTAIVFDSHEYRNERADHMHMVPTLDGNDPEAFREAARKNTTDNYSLISFVNTKITSAKKDGEIFIVTNSEGKCWTGRGLVLATGGVDVMLEIPGFAECWGRSIFHCLFCFGYEQRGSVSSGILAADMNLHVPLYMHVARNALQLSETVTIYTNGDTSRTASFQSSIGPKASVQIDERRVSKFELGENGIGVNIFFEDGSSKYEAFLAHNPEVQPRSSELIKELGLEVTDKGVVVTQAPFGETNVPGCFAAGDAVSTVRMIPTAISTGAVAASGVAGHVQSKLQEQMSVGEFLRGTQKK